MSDLTLADVPVLRFHGFVRGGTSGWCWYGEDNNGMMWQAYEDKTKDQLIFRPEVEGNKWGEFDTMDSEKFYASFPEKRLV